MQGNLTYMIKEFLEHLNWNQTGIGWDVWGGGERTEDLDELGSSKKGISGYIRVIVSFQLNRVDTT